MTDPTLPTEDSLCAEFEAWTTPLGFTEGDAFDLLHRDDLSPEQRRWLSNFVGRWEAMENRRRSQS